MRQRGRFAPSPTGELHLGNARTALLAWLWARSGGGGFTMRVEDLDRPRVRPGLAERQIEEMAWLGLDWDDGPWFQSRRAHLYDEAIAKLGDRVYPCFCSRAEIAAAASAPHEGEEGPRYPGTCASLTPAEQKARGRKPSLRLRVPPGPVEFHDELAGPQRFDPGAEVGDFVLRRADGIHAYQLAVVVDDAAMECTQVLRGADLLSSTARQILLYRMLGLPEPRWAHAPLVLAADGSRLAKRDKPASLAELRRSSDPRQVVGLLASVSGLAPAGTACTPAELLPGFALDRVPRGPARLVLPVAPTGAV